MIGGVAWPDLVMLGILLFAAFHGWSKGLIHELTGTVAFLIALGAAFLYPGTFDVMIKAYTHLGPGSAHVVGTVAFAAIAYAIVYAIGHALAQIAKLPLIATVNSAGGAAIGLFKGLAFLWIVLFVALYFPLTRDLRADLANSSIANALTQWNRGIDGGLRHGLPWFAQPIAQPWFGRHHL